MKRRSDDDRSSCESQFPFGRSRRRFNVMQWDSEMRVVSGSGARPNGMVDLLFVSACSCGLPVFRQSQSYRNTGVVNHRPCGQPMHHSVLLEKEGVEPRGQSSSSKQAVVRQDRVAKRNPKLARVRTGGITPLPSPLLSREQPLTASLNSDQFGPNIQSIKLLFLRREIIGNGFHDVL